MFGPAFAKSPAVRPVTTPIPKIVLFIILRKDFESGFVYAGK